MAAVIGRAVGHKVRHVRTPLWMFYKAAKAQGLEPILLRASGITSKTMTAARSRSARPTTRYAGLVALRARMVRDLDGFGVQRLGRC